ncbi:MAG: hypothetical protein V1720_14025 [bacterium]
MEKKIEFSKCPGDKTQNQFEFSRCNCEHTWIQNNNEVAVTQNNTYKYELSCICIIEPSLLTFQSSNPYTDINSGKSLKEVPIFLVTGMLLI